MANTTAHATIRRCERGFVGRNFAGRRIGEDKSEAKPILPRIALNNLKVAFLAADSRRFRAEFRTQKPAFLPC
jgi:hypothetical protein